MQLHHLQRQFWNELHSAGKCKYNYEFIHQVERLSASKRLNIYKRTTLTAHINALAQCYNCCENILGEKYFKQLAKQYFYQHPSMSQNLNEYGYHFSNFLQMQIDKRKELIDYLYLPDLARLEFSFEQAYFSKNSNNFNYEALTNIDEDKYPHLCFELNASLSLLQSNYPIYEIWQTNRVDSFQHEIPATSKPQNLCIYRKNFKPVIEDIAPSDWCLLHDIQNELYFSQLEKKYMHKNNYLDLKHKIPEFIEKNWICGFFIKHNF